MDAFDSIRLAAAELHRVVVEKGANPNEPLALARAGVFEKELELAIVPVGDDSLNGARALFDEQSSLIVCEEATSDWEKATLIAHELGHACSHAGGSKCISDDIDTSRSVEASPVGMARVEDYGVRERRELQANVFAREFLLPRPVAIKLHTVNGLKAEAIASRTGLPINLIRQQLFDALLLPPLKAESKQKSVPETTVREANDSQRAAAYHTGSPFQLQAGPGTGKTRTLIDRIAWLIRQGADPASILVLTFSNRAAAELIERLAKELPNEAPKVWAGTFHSFGLDIVRRYHDRFGLSAKPALYDTSRTIEAMEELFPTLPLVHHRSIWNPTNVLCDVLSAVSRAKDELVNPTQYRALGEAMFSAAKSDDDARVAAEKCIEVADVYERYQALLSERDAVDFGDLVMKPTLLLEAVDEIRTTLQFRHRHILVDEYQDVNYASARLLRALSGDGSRLWVVGDARQAIYRFRGASPSNMAAFASEYTGARIQQLDVNYRSTKEIVDVFQSIAPRMASSKGMLDLRLSSFAGASNQKPEIFVYEGAGDELDGIAASVRDLHGAGLAFKHQAVLCHSNARLDLVSGSLEARGIPCLYLGSVFERSEVRDLLSLLSILVDPYCDALTRVGVMPRYGLTMQDVREATQSIRDLGLPALEGLRTLAHSTNALSSLGKVGLTRLVEDLAGVESNWSAWQFLSSYLLDRTDLGRTLAFGNTPQTQVNAIAVWQLLNFIREQRPAQTGLPIQQVLFRIRQLVLLGEDRDLRRIPECASEIDAVRVMTIHGSKGLEFDAVHLSGLNDQAFPARAMWKRCEPPIGLVVERFGIRPPDEATAKRHEEECLFFVALSRARKILRLYLCSKKSDGKARGPSEFLDWLPPSFVTRSLTNPRFSHALPAVNPVGVINVRRKAAFSVTDSRLAAFEKCPRRFFYSHVLGLGGARKSSAFVRTQNCFFEFMRALAEVRHIGAMTLPQLEELFEETWRNKGPTDHAYAADYRALSSKLVSSLHKSSAGLIFLKARPIEVALSNGAVVVEPSEIANASDGSFVLRRIKTGSMRKNDVDKDLVWAIYIMAAERAFKGSVSVQAVHLSGDTVEAVTLTAKKLAFRKERVDVILSQINSGSFLASPADGEECSECPHFFLCDAIPTGDLEI